MKFAFAQAPIIGIDLGQFWQLTPYAFNLILEAHNKKAAEDFDLIKYQTWHIAAFYRMKKLPDFRKYIKPLTNTQETGINEAGIKAALKAHTHGQSRKS